MPYLFLIPVFTGIISVIVRGDHLAPPQLIGGMVALAGVAVARMYARTAGRIETIVPAEETGMAPDPEPSPRAIPGP